MKITKAKLRELIKEELKTVAEDEAAGPWWKNDQMVARIQSQHESKTLGDLVNLLVGEATQLPKEGGHGQLASMIIGLALALKAKVPAAGAAAEDAAPEGV